MKNIISFFQLLLAHFMFMLAYALENFMFSQGLAKAAVDFSDLPKNLINGDNMGGIVTDKIFYGKWDDVLQWPTLAEAPASLDDLGQWTGDIIMKSSKAMYEIYATENTGFVTINSVGEQDGLSMEVAFGFFVPGIDKKTLGFLRNAKNEGMFFLPRDNEGQYYLIGDELRAARMVPGEAGGTGTETSARKGITFNYMYRTNGLCHYSGNVSAIAGLGSV